MTSPPQGTAPTDDLPGPDAASARRARRLGAGVAAALVLVAGGATATYAASLSGDPGGTGYGTLVDPTTGAAVDGPIEITTDEPVTVPGGRWDCPERSGGSDGGTTPAPGTSTL